MVDQLFDSDVNKRRIATVESYFVSNGITLNIPGRVLIGEGVLTKVCRKGPKHRQFYLFNDILMYGTIIISKRLYSQPHIIPLHEISVKSIDNNEQYCNAWIIHTKTKSFIVYSGNGDEKIQWIDHINRCIHDLLRKSGKQLTEVHAALWVPDAEARTCMNCNKNFTLFVRRHHCRNCGIVVCASCSSNTFILPSHGNAPVRVCQSCYYILKQKSIVNQSKRNVDIINKIDENSEDSVNQSESNEAVSGDNNLSDKPGPIFYTVFSRSSLEELTNKLANLKEILSSRN